MGVGPQGDRTTGRVATAHGAVDDERDGGHKPI